MQQPQNLVDLAAMTVVHHCKVEHIILTQEVLWALEDEEVPNLLLRKLDPLVGYKHLAHKITTFVIRQHFQYYDALKTQPTGRNDPWNQCSLCIHYGVKTRYQRTPYKLRELITYHLFEKLCCEKTGIIEEWELIDIAQTAVHEWSVNQYRTHFAHKRMSYYHPEVCTYYNPFTDSVEYDSVYLVPHL